MTFHSIRQMLKRKEGVFMIVHRWQAPVLPTAEQIYQIFEREGLRPFEEVYTAGRGIDSHLHPFDEVRMLVKGSLLFDIAGNRLLLRAGDKIIIPSNTRHSKKNQGPGDCVCICSYKAF